MNTRAMAASAVLGLGSCAGAAAAQHGLFLTFSTDNGQSWQKDVTAEAGSTVLGRVRMTIPDQYWGIAGARYNITTVGDGWDVGGNDWIDLTPGKGNPNDGRVAWMDFGGQTQTVFEQGHSMRIDAAGDNNNWPGAGISTSQGSSVVLGTNFATNKNVIVYKFAIHLNAAPITRQITLQIPDGELNGSIDQITSFKVYETQGSTSGTTIDGEAGDTGTIHVVPSPAGSVIFLVSVGGKRRRRAVA